MDDPAELIWILELSTTFGALETRRKMHGALRITAVCSVCGQRVELVEDRCPYYVATERRGSRWITRAAWTHSRDCYAEHERRERELPKPEVDLWNP